MKFDCNLAVDADISIQKTFRTKIVKKYFHAIFSPLTHAHIENNQLLC